MTTQSTGPDARPSTTWLRRLRCWYWGHPDAAYFARYCPKCGVRMDEPRPTKKDTRDDAA